jgi:hypothetical protein
VQEHAEFLRVGSRVRCGAAPQNYTRVPIFQGNRVVAFGRDPYFAAWRRCTSTTAISANESTKLVAYDNGTTIR